MDFDTIMAAIGSNNGRLGYTDGKQMGKPRDGGSVPPAAQSVPPSSANPEAARALPNSHTRAVVLVFERTDASVQRVLPGGARRRLDDDNDDENWSLGGTSVDGVSTPIRPKPDRF